MRFALLAVATALCAVSCSSPDAPSLHYSAPSAAPVREKIVSAQGHAAAAQRAIARARAADDPAQLQLALADANREIDQLTLDLLNAQDRVTELENQAKLITDAANTAATEKNEAIARADKADAKAKNVARQRNRLVIFDLALLAWILRKPIASGAGFIARKFVGIPF